MSPEISHTKLFANRLQAEYDELCKKAVPYKGTVFLNSKQENHFKRLLKSAGVQKTVLGYVTNGTKHALKGFMVRCDYWDREQCKALKICFNDLVKLKTELERAHFFFEKLPYFKDWKLFLKQRAEEIHLNEFLIEEEYWSLRFSKDVNNVPADELPYLTLLKLRLEASNNLSNDNFVRYCELYKVKIEHEYGLVHQLFFDFEDRKRSIRMFKSKTQVKSLIRSYCRYYNKRFEKAIEESEVFAKRELNNLIYAQKTIQKKIQREFIGKLKRSVLLSYYQDCKSIRDTMTLTGYSKSDIGRVFKEFKDQGVPKLQTKIQL